MKHLPLLLILIILPFKQIGQDLYVKTFGQTGKPAIIFLHGGPGYNCANFEVTTAQKLSEQGYFVLVYDRRGEGRSTKANAQFTFDQTNEDLQHLYEQYKLKKATLIGHSFGGLVATHFAEKYPQQVENIIFVGAPVSLQNTFKTILAKSENIYLAKKDSTNLTYVKMIRQMDSTSLTYGSFCFGHAMQNGFYTPKEPTARAKEIYSLFKTDSILTQYASKMTMEAPQGFWKNEHYTTMDLTNNIANLIQKKIPVYGMYGKDDGLYSEAQVMALHKQLGENNLIYIDQCSHNVFIDQQEAFLSALKTWMGK